MRNIPLFMKHLPMHAPLSQVGSTVLILRCLCLIHKNRTLDAEHNCCVELRLCHALAAPTTNLRVPQKHNRMRYINFLLAPLPFVFIITNIKHFGQCGLLDRSKTHRTAEISVDNDFIRKWKSALPKMCVRSRWFPWLSPPYISKSSANYDSDANERYLSPDLVDSTTEDTWNVMLTNPQRKDSGQTFASKLLSEWWLRIKNVM